MLIIKNSWEKRTEDSLMLATIRDDTRNMVKMQHVAPKYKKMGSFRHPLVRALEKTKGPTYIVEGGRRLH